MNPLLLILLLPILEIVGFIQVGDWIGAGPTIGLLVLSAVVGTMLVRHRGLAVLTRGQAATAQGELPIGAVLDGFCAVAAGILLIIPGFLTDLLGLMLLVPALRRGLGRWLLTRMGGNAAFQLFGSVEAGGSGFQRPGNGPVFRRDDQPDRPQPGVIDGEYRDVSGEAPGCTQDSQAPGTRQLSDSQWGNRNRDGQG